MNYFKRKRIIGVKACCCGMQVFKKIRLVIFFYYFLNPSFKMTASFASATRTTAGTSKLYTTKDSNPRELGHYNFQF